MIIRKFNELIKTWESVQFMDDYKEEKIFDGISFSIIKFSKELAHKRYQIMKDIIQNNGGEIIDTKNINEENIPNFIISSKNLSMIKFKDIITNEKIQYILREKVIDYQWITDCVKNKRIMDKEFYYVFGLNFDNIGIENPISDKFYLLSKIPKVENNIKNSKQINCEFLKKENNLLFYTKDKINENADKSIFSKNSKKFQKIPILSKILENDGKSKTNSWILKENNNTNKDNFHQNFISQVKDVELKSKNEEKEKQVNNLEKISKNSKKKINSLKSSEKIKNLSNDSDSKKSLSFLKDFEDEKEKEKFTFHLKYILSNKQKEKYIMDSKEKSELNKNRTIINNTQIESKPIRSESEIIYSKEIPGEKTNDNLVAIEKRNENMSIKKKSNYLKEKLEDIIEDEKSDLLNNTSIIYNSRKIFQSDQKNKKKDEFFNFDKEIKISQVKQYQKFKNSTKSTNPIKENQNFNFINKSEEEIHLSFTDEIKEENYSNACNQQKIFNNFSSTDFFNSKLSDFEIPNKDNIYFNKNESEFSNNMKKINESGVTKNQDTEFPLKSKEFNIDKTKFAFYKSSIQMNPSDNKMENSNSQNLVNSKVNIQQDKKIEIEIKNNAYTKYVENSFGNFQFSQMLSEDELSITSDFEDKKILKNRDKKGKMDNFFPNKLTQDSSHMNKSNSNSNISLQNSQSNLNSHITDFLEKMLEYHTDENNTFESLAYRRAISQIKNAKEKINKESQLGKYKYIGKSIKIKIKEILRTGTLSKLDVLQKDEKNKIIKQLKNVYGIGHELANKLYNKGINSIEDLRNNQHLLTLNQIIGLKYYEDLLLKISREECEDIFQIVKNEASIIVRKELIQMELCGSYRRGKKTVGDLDILITITDGRSINGILSSLVEKLCERKLIVEILNLSNELSERNASLKKHNFMGICKLKHNPHRRIDIKIYEKELYPFALLYFTGSAYFNRSLRLYAKKKNFSLSDNGLTFNKSGKEILEVENIKCESEHDIFLALGVEYKSPNERDI